MTLNYKILGQLYYGPEINQEPEIPGTSGYYTSVTGGIEPRFLIGPTRSESPTQRVAHSSDGINWTEAIVPTSFDTSAIVYGNGKFLNFLIGSQQYFYSSDGVAWTAASKPDSALDAWNAVAYGDGKFVAMGSGFGGGTTQAYYSTDGINWTEVSLPVSGVWHTATYADGKFVVVEYSGDKSISSTDGINWTASTLPVNTGWADITYGNGIFLVIPITANQSVYSTDGINWTSGTVPALEPGGFSRNSVVFGNDKFIMLVYQSTNLFYSTDGITWTSGIIAADRIFFDVAFGDGKFIAAGPSFGSNLPVSAYSTDGVNWTLGSYITTGTWVFATFGQVSTLVEVQISIGGQGTPGSYVELVEPQVVYTVPSGTQTTITSIFVTNHDSVERTFDLAIVPSGETLALKHHIRWDMPVNATDFDLINAKITMGAGDQVYVFPSTVNKVGFTLFGVEKS